MLTNKYYWILITFDGEILEIISEGITRDNIQTKIIPKFINKIFLKSMITGTLSSIYIDGSNLTNPKAFWITISISRLMVSMWNA